MRVLLSSSHRYPAAPRVGAGPRPRRLPSRSAYSIHDLLAKGLAELGHDVSYLLPRGASVPLPPGVSLVSAATEDADVLHTIAYHDEDLTRERQSRARPWVTTCHLDLRARGMERGVATENWIFVSRTLARLHGRERYVLNGVDPADYVFSETKDDYFLFMSTMDWEMKKGLDVVLRLARRVGFRLVVAGTGTHPESIRRVAELCREARAVYVGDVRGRRKAELLAGARAFLFPTKVDEAFGLGMVEALMSGTPVICSDRGACPEVISADVGFVCRGEEEYVAAVGRVSDISPRACREKALGEYHYLRMAADYAAEYEKEVARRG
jgi:glycosyltransferase involved in cell wall biosynthesis